MKFTLTLDMDNPAQDTPRFAAEMKYALGFVAGQLTAHLEHTPHGPSDGGGPIHNHDNTVIGHWHVTIPKPEPDQGGLRLTPDQP